ncbi:UNVERIFIED_CONTAM: hypothetical protein Slati_1131800 [Sesamum latifolium]|uniref:Transposase n=1 Tax=Sesamum latifolium TaxID=2727402 RepID=A0AAW2XC11_9LAMI
MLSRIPEQVMHLHDIIDIIDVKCVDNLRMTRNAFGRSCQMLEFFGGLRATRHVTIMKQVAIFLSIISHHKKNCVVKHAFVHSGRTISIHFHSVLMVVLHLHPILLPRPAPIQEGCQDSRWRWFKGCLGALDDTHVDIRVSEADKGRYQNRKGQISVNMLGVCNTDGKFTYVLSGWEGSAADSRVLRDAINRPSGLKVLRVIPWGSSHRILEFVITCEIETEEVAGHRIVRSYSI